MKPLVSLPVPSALLGLLGAAASPLLSFCAETVSETGKAVLDGYHETMAGLESFSVTIDSRAETGFGKDGSLEFRFEWMIEATEPNYIRAEYANEIRSHSASGVDEASTAKSLISDGVTSHLIHHSAAGSRIYKTLAAPQDFRQVFDPEVWARSRDVRYVMSEMDVLPYLVPQTVNGLMTRARYQGLEEVDGMLFHVFQVDHGFDYQMFGATYRLLYERLFFEEDVPFLLRRYEKRLEIDDERLSGLDTSVIHFRDWRLNPSLARERFRWQPSSEYREVEELAPEMSDEMRREIREMFNF